jgi:hypothetical protein
MKTQLRFIGVAGLCLMLAWTGWAAIAPASPKPEIVVTCALFGSGKDVVDVTKRVSELLRTEPRGFDATADWLGADPIPRGKKALAITYECKGRHWLFVICSTQTLSYDLLLRNAMNAKHSETSPEL